MTVLAETQPGADWGERIANAISALPSTGGIVDARALEGSQSLSGTLTIAKSYTTILLGPMALAMGSFSIVVTGGTHSISLVGAASYGAQAGGGAAAGTNLVYTGNGNAIQVGNTSSDTFFFRAEDVVVNTSAGGTAAAAFALFRCLVFYLARPRAIMTTSASSQNGIVLDGTNGFCGNGTILAPSLSNGFRGIYGVGSGVNGMNAVSVLGGQINGPSNGTGIGIHVIAGAANTIVGTDLEGWQYGFVTTQSHHLVQARYEGSASADVLFDTGSSDNLVIGTSGSGLSPAGTLVVSDLGTNNTAWAPAQFRVSASGAVSASGDAAFAGGYRQTVGPWVLDNVAAGQTAVALSGTRWVAPRAGSVTAVVVKSTEARTAGSLTVGVYRNVGLSQQAGSAIGLTAVLDAGNTGAKATTQEKDVSAFAAGDELYPLITTTPSWAPVSADVRVYVEVET